MSIKIIDDFANINEQIEIINYLKNNDFLLYSFDTSSVSEVRFMTSNTIDYPQIVHSIFKTDKINSKFLFCMIYQLINKNRLSNKFIDRIKINTTFPYPKNNKEKHGPIHKDFNENNKNKAISIIYYVNNSDGDTLFFDQKLNITKRVSPRQGRAVIFDSDIKHAANCPINSTYRQVISIVLYI